MADDVLKEAGPAPEAGKVRREPPTIDLEATKVAETGSASKSGEKAGETKSEAKSDARPAAEPRVEAEPRPEPAQTRASRSASPWIVAPISGAAAAALVLAVGWFMGWPATQAPTANPPASAATVDELTTRVAGLEQKVAKPPAPVADPATAARIDGVEKSMATLRGDLASLRAQSDKLAAAVSAAKSAPGEAASAAAAIDLSAINERIDAIERDTRAQAAAIASEKAAVSKAQDDVPLRRVVAAALLDVAVRHGDPFAGELAAAKALSPDPAKLKPLDDFSAKGVPNPFVLNRELLALVPKLSPPAANSTAGGGLVDRLQAGAAKLVRVERTDAAGNDRSAVVARVTAAALRNDFADARRELASLDPADRAPAQAWLDKAAARDAALAASRQFVEEAMASLAKAAQ
jgi:hypothetical protein